MQVVPVSASKIDGRFFAGAATAVSNLDAKDALRSLKKRQSHLNECSRALNSDITTTKLPKALLGIDVDEPLPSIS